MRRTAFLAMAAALATIALAAMSLGPASATFMAHRYCLDATRHPILLWVTVVSNVAIAGAYYVIPVGLMVAAVRGFAPAPGLFYLFAAFILACGTSHVFDAWVMWEPVYWAQAVVLSVTAVISWVTVHAIVAEARRALPATAIIGRVLREAADECDQGDDAEARRSVSEAMRLIAAYLQRLQGTEQ